MTDKTVLIVGASGVVGQAAVEHFARLDGWSTVALSRRPPDLAAGISCRHIATDLTDAQGCRNAMASLGSVTHLVYAALHEKPGLVAGWRDRDQMATNLAMLCNVLTPLRQHPLQHVSLLQGTKAYGVHLHRIQVPARERWPRDRHENFYWLQEDHLRAEAARHGFAFTIFRPQIVFGDAIGAAMNITPVLAAYAAICRAEGLAFSYPGGPPYVLEAVDAGLMARALAWAAQAPNAAGETFNITNGDVFVWHNVWPAIADVLGVEAGPAVPRRLADFLPSKAATWERIATGHGLRCADLGHLLGQSHHYADFCLATGLQEPPPPVLVSTIKLRQAGFSECIDTETMFHQQLASLVAKRIVPPAKSAGRGAIGRNASATMGG
jgi:nucleoside-diphosphate-sugar epimerase